MSHTILKLEKKPFKMFQSLFQSDVFTVGTTQYVLFTFRPSVYPPLIRYWIEYDGYST